LIPRAGKLLWIGGRWLVRHPQPFVLIGVLWGTGWLLSSYVQRADVLRIAQVQLPADGSLQLRRPLVGEHLLMLDIRSLAEEFQRQQPSTNGV
jgi:hypothetical protein